MSKKKKKTNEEDEDDSMVPSGSFVTLWMDKVPIAAIEEYSSSEGLPLVIYGLLAHEQKMSLVNLVIKKHHSCTVPIKNKQNNLVFHVGFRRFQAQPIFSQHTNGDKYKMERYLPAEVTVVASIFAPVTFPPCPVLVFRRDNSNGSNGSNGDDHLVATGSILDINPDRIVLKRIVLSGHPYKINRRSSVVRYMFFNREDIEWFKPVELHTPRGRRGHIREAVGTHGHMKCSFDQQLNSQDAVMMALYKRVYPKWTFIWDSAGRRTLVETQKKMDP